MITYTTIWNLKVVLKQYIQNNPCTTLNLRSFHFPQSSCSHFQTKFPKNSSEMKFVFILGALLALLLVAGHQASSHRWGGVRNNLKNFKTQFFKNKSDFNLYRSFPASR